jgi:hypothetical protein
MTDLDAQRTRRADSIEMILPQVAFIFFQIWKLWSCQRSRIDLILRPLFCLTHRVDFYWRLIRWLDGVIALRAREFVLLRHRCSALWFSTHNCETRQGSILSFPNNHYNEWRFLPGLKAGVSTPNI